MYPPTAKDKAESLINSFMITCLFEDKLAIETALQCVNEILFASPSNREYWHEVKNEIVNKLN